MAKLKLTCIPDDKPVKVTIELPAAVLRDLTAYAEAIRSEGGQAAPEPAKLIVPMIQRFMATDHVFMKARRSSPFTTFTSPAEGGTSDINRSDRS